MSAQSRLLLGKSTAFSLTAKSPGGFSPVSDQSQRGAGGVQEPCLDHTWHTENPWAPEVSKDIDRLGCHQRRVA